MQRFVKTERTRASGGNADFWPQLECLCEILQIWSLSLKSFPHNFSFHKNLTHDFNMTKCEYRINSTFKKSQLLYFFSFNKLFFFFFF